MKLNGFKFFLFKVVDQQHSNFIPGTITDPPPKVGKWKAHKSGVVSVKFAGHDEGPFVVSGSTDGSVKLWTLNGGLIGMFGQVKILNS